jgi:hypothetical protein
VKNIRLPIIDGKTYVIRSVKNTTGSVGFVSRREDAVPRRSRWDWETERYTPEAAADQAKLMNEVNPSYTFEPMALETDHG